MECCCASQCHLVTVSTYSRLTLFLDVTANRTPFEASIMSPRLWKHLMFSKLNSEIRSISFCSSFFFLTWLILTSFTRDRSQLLLPNFQWYRCTSCDYLICNTAYNEFYSFQLFTHLVNKVISHFLSFLLLLLHYSLEPSFYFE